MGEKFNIEDFPASESALKMLSYVTKGFYDRSYVGKWLYQVMGLEYDDVMLVLKSLPDQIFPETATWGLAYHEMKWGLPVRENLTYVERRKLICQKRDYKASMVPHTMEKYLEQATGFEVHIADIHDPGYYGFVPAHPNIFKAYFVGEGTLDLKVAYETLNRLRQSHTEYIINDRLEAVSDNRDLNHATLENVRFRMTSTFWYVHEYTLDGSWPLDGNVFLHTRESYQLLLGVKYAMSVYTSQRDAAVTLETKSPGRWFLDGAVPLDGTRSLDSIYKKEEIS